jgi:hypothetical protein
MEGGTNFHSLFRRGKPLLKRLRKALLRRVAFVLILLSLPYGKRE